MPTLRADSYGQLPSGIIADPAGRARQRAKAKTGRCEGQRPYGHYEGEQEVLERMKQMRAQGLSFDKIAEALNAAGLKPRTGERWWGKTVNNIVTARERGAK